MNLTEIAMGRSRDLRLEVPCCTVAVFGSARRWVSLRAGDRRSIEEVANRAVPSPEDNVDPLHRGELPSLRGPRDQELNEELAGLFVEDVPPRLEALRGAIGGGDAASAMFTTYAGGEQTHTETIELPFDPTEDFHDCAFFYDEDSITFYVDGELVKEFEGGLPKQRMKLYVNSWFPRWLGGEKLPADRHAYVDWIER